MKKKERPSFFEGTTHQNDPKLRIFFPKGFTVVFYPKFTSQKLNEKNMKKVLWLFFSWTIKEFSNLKC